MANDFNSHDTTGNHLFDPTYVGGRRPKRSLILWESPHLGTDRYIEMYVNPQSIDQNQRKTTTLKRTKGGFILQYWGEELETLTISGDTADSGVEGLNVLLDVFHSEQLAMADIAEQANASNTVKRRQSLASLLASTTMWYQGQGKRGFITGFNSSESVQNNGSFTFRIEFTVVETIGKRANFMPWHRKPWSTTETPNMGPGGVVVTGGYNTRDRLGKLNSPSSYLELQIKEDPLTGDIATREVLVQNTLFDPKYKRLTDITDLENNIAIPSDVGVVTNEPNNDIPVAAPANPNGRAPNSATDAQVKPLVKVVS